MSIRRSSRLLTTLTSPSPTTSSLVPPYSHSQAIPEEPSPSLRPPYAHSSTSPSIGQKDVNGKVVQPKLKYALLDRSVEGMKREKEEAYLAWAAGLGEETIQKVWDETLTALNQVHQDGVRPFSLIGRARPSLQPNLLYRTLIRHRPRYRRCHSTNSPST